MEFTEEYDKVLKWSQNTHNPTHTYMYGIHPKNMTRFSNGLKILTRLPIATCMEFTEEYDKVLKWSQNTYNSTHSYMYGIHRRLIMIRCSNGRKILTSLLVAICMEFTEEYGKLLK